MPKKRRFPPSPQQQRMNLAHTLAINTPPCPKEKTGSNMLPDPTERNVNPLQFQARIRTVKKLVLTLDIHDKNVTISSQHELASLCGQDLPFHLKRAHSQTAAHHRSAILPAISIPRKGSRSQQLAQHTMASSGVRKHPQPDKQRPAPLISMRPDSCASSIRV